MVLTMLEMNTEVCNNIGVRILELLENSAFEKMCRNVKIAKSFNPMDLLQGLEKARIPKTLAK